MVNYIIVSEYDEVRAEPSGSRKIGGGPLYRLPRVQALCGDTTQLLLWTHKCVTDVQGLGMDIEDVAALIRELGARNYIDSEWCRSGSAWAACDAYRRAWSEWMAGAGKRMDMEYFPKFAIGRTGELLLVVSCHLSR